MLEVRLAPWKAGEESPQVALRGDHEAKGQSDPYVSCQNPREFESKIFSAVFK